MIELPVRIDFDLPKQPLSIWRLTPERVTTETAQAHLGLLAAAYTVQLEDRSNSERPLPPGSAAAEFDASNPGRVADRLELIRSTMGRGSQYLEAYDKSAQLIGLINSSPSYANGQRGKERGDKPNIFINDVAVRPDNQDRGVGSALMYSALKFNGYNAEARIALHAFFRSHVPNDWYRNRLKLVPRRRAGSIKINGLYRAQTLYVSKVGTPIGAAAERLAAQRPELLQSTISYAQPVDNGEISD